MIRRKARNEADRYTELKLMERSGLITDLKLQVPFVLLGKVYFEEEKRWKQKIVYIADFTYFCFQRNRRIIEDVKSAETSKNPLYRNKKHMMKSLLDLEITEV